MVLIIVFISSKLKYFIKMKISQNPKFKETEKIRKYLGKDVVLSYYSAKTLIEKVGLLESVSESALTIRTTDNSTFTIPYTMKLKID